MWLFYIMFVFDDKQFNTIDDYQQNQNNIIYNTVYILIEAKFDVSINIDKLYNDEYIYHISELKYKDKILKNGLVAKSKSKLSYHIDRIYFETNKFNLMYLSKQLSNEPIIFKIKINDIKHLKFYIDPNHDSGIYTFENIKKETLQIL